jgi:hypothetical protein
VVGYHAFAILRGEEKTFSLSDDEKQMLKKIAYESIKDSLDGKGIAAANSSLFTFHSSL